MEQAVLNGPQLSDYFLKRLVDAYPCINFDGHGNSMWVGIDSLRVDIHHEANIHAISEIAPAGFRRSNGPHVLRRRYIEEMYRFNPQARTLSERGDQATTPLCEDVLIESVYASGAL